MHDTESTPADPVLIVAPGTMVRLRGGGQVEICAGGCRRLADIRTLGILEQFAKPIRMSEFIDLIQTERMGDFVESTGLAMRLRNEGVLVEASCQPVRLASGFDAPWAHVKMLDDLTRTRAFTRAIHQVVRPGDILIDIGTGTGVLAVEAVRAGAALVYAIEERAIADAAARIFVANGVAERVRLVRGRSTRVDLPERANVLVSEILANDPLGEDIISIFRDARARLLLPGARLIPSSVDIIALPVDLPEQFLSEETFTEKNTARWCAALAMDFRPLAEFSYSIANLPDVRPQDIRDWTVVGEPLLLARADLASIDAVSATASTFVARRSAENLGFVLCFDADLAPGVVISTLPSAAADDNCWTCRVFRANARRRVAAGDAITVHFSGETGESVINAV